ncbi:hypothetical protein M0813_04373 [Anaeramoeba flamelloides]|uniref:Uncharacterized protein n=1 Tax=Anaeramoeba flamelloides TaxID=1746091 RepID=A0AAV7Y4Q6_9EUKA|nr:hypothetical protein M0812_27255 [Anaeramoeba flamelloides]KAJ6232846.1 hypothetical protein M0813_04373 [Anaeramoeba flamelloides]
MKESSKYRKVWNRFVVMSSSLSFLVLYSTQTILIKYLNEKLGIVFPWMTVLLLTGGWPINMIIWVVRYIKRKSVHALSWSYIGAYACLGLMDAVRMSLMSFGLNYLSGGTYMVLKGTNAIFTVIMTKIFLKHRRIINLHWLSVAFFTLSMSILAVGGSKENESENDEQSSSEYLVGFICTITSSIANSAQSVIAEKYFRKLKKGRSFTRAAEVAAFNGLFSFLFSCILPFAVGEHHLWINTYSDDSFDGKRTTFIVFCVLIACSKQFGYLFKFSLTDFISAFYVSVLDMCRRVIVVILCVILFNEPFGWSKILSLCLMLVGFGVYLFASRKVKQLQKMEEEIDQEKKLLIPKQNNAIN